MFRLCRLVVHSNKIKLKILCIYQECSTNNKHKDHNIFIFMIPNFHRECSWLLNNIIIFYTFWVFFWMQSSFLLIQLCFTQFLLNIIWSNIGHKLSLCYEPFFAYFGHSKKKGFFLHNYPYWFFLSLIWIIYLPFKMDYRTPFVFYFYENNNLTLQV